MRKNFFLLLLSLLFAVEISAQDKFWVIDKNRVRTEFSVDEVDSCQFTKLSFVVRRNDGTRFTKPFLQIEELTFEHPGKEVYKPAEFRQMDFTDETSQWCWARSRETENVIVFWEAGFGADPSTAPEPYRVDIDDLLAKAEHYVDFYTNRLGFAVPGSSNTDKYKLEIYLKYQTEWLATGSGYDDVIGALWVNPSTCKPVGHTIAHEVGHSFQYQTRCDAGSEHGWRYGFGVNGSGGNAYWESCAQWQGFKIYPEQQFTDYRFANYCRSTHYNPLHEAPRYDLFFDQDYWCHLHGENFMGRLWREAVYPEDPFEAYMRLTGLTQEQFNDEMYDRATRFATWDIPALRTYGTHYHGAQAITLKAAGEPATWMPDSAQCPQNYGYNLVRLNVPEAGTQVTADFTGLAGAAGYRSINLSQAGWRYGFVALTETGERVYGTPGRTVTGTASLTVPEGCTYLWFVAMGAPKTHWHHPWDDDASNDEQWPYRVRFDGTNLYGEYTFADDYKRSNLTLTYDVELPFDPSSWGYTRFALPDISPVCRALGLSASELRSKLGTEVDFVAVNSYGTLTSESNTSNGCGHWFSAAGNVVDYGASSYIYSEYQKDSFTFHLGQYPGRCTVGRTYTVREGFRYAAPDGKRYLVTFVFNVKIVP